MPVNRLTYSPDFVGHADRARLAVDERISPRGDPIPRPPTDSPGSNKSARASPYYIGRTPSGSSRDEAKFVRSDLIGRVASVKVSTGSPAASDKCASPSTALSVSIAPRA